MVWGGMCELPSTNEPQESAGGTNTRMGGEQLGWCCGVNKVPVTSEVTGTWVGSESVIGWKEPLVVDVLLLAFGSLF